MESINEQRRSTQTAPASRSTPETEDSPRLDYVLAADKRAVRPQNVLQLQRQIGNRATAAALKHQPKPAADAGLKGLIHRTIDYSDALEYPIFAQALGLFHSIESEDLSVEELDLLKGQHQRFMPLLSRFEHARGINLKIGTGLKNVTGDFAVTELFAVPADGGKRLEYDSSKDEFNQLAQHKQIKQFEIRVLINRMRVRGEEVPNTLKTVGTILQALTHEMSVHAENMLDYTEQYWNYFDDKGAPPAPLGSSSDEHKEFKGGGVSRYEFMSKRTKGRGDTIGEDFGKREAQDLYSAK